MKIFLAFLLGLLFFPNFYFQFIFSKRANLLRLFERNWVCYYLDGIFVAFNFLLPFSIKTNWPIVLLSLLVSLAGNFVIHRTWGDDNKRGGTKHHVFYESSDRLNTAGLTHFIFSTVQTALIAIFIFSQPLLPFYYFGTAIIFVFSIFSVFGSYKLHHKLILVDLLVAIILFLAMVLKLAI